MHLLWTTNDPHYPPHTQDTVLIIKKKSKMQMKLKSAKPGTDAITKVQFVDCSPHAGLAGVELQGVHQGPAHHVPGQRHTWLVYTMSSPLHVGTD